MKKQIIVVRLMGGLGNQLFQYAYAKRISYEANISEKKVKVILDASSYKCDKKRSCIIPEFDSAFSVSDSVIMSLLDFIYKLCIHINRFPKWLIRESRTTELEESKMDSFTSKFSYVVGFWQNSSFIQSIKRELKNEIVLSSDILKSKRYEEIEEKIKESNSVAIHVRRGDYLSETNRKIYKTQDINYYNTAIDRINNEVENPVYLVFSDDVEWCKKELPKLTDRNIYYVEDYCISDDVQQFELMKMCKHFIIGNSTFSWWASWLSDYNDGFRIAPQMWYYDKEKNDIIIRALLNNYILY